MIGSLLSNFREAVALLLADVAGILGLFSLTHFLRIGQGRPDLLSLSSLVGVFLLTMYVLDVYGGVLREGSIKLVVRTAFAVLIAAGVVASLVYIIKPAESNALYWRGVLPVGTAMFLVWAVVCRKIVAAWMQSRAPGRWLVLGYGQLASCLWRDVGAKSGLGQLCFLNHGSEDAGSTVNTPLPEGVVSDLPRFLERSWSGVILATEQAPGDATLSELMRARLSGVRIYDLTDFYERFLFKLPVLNLRDNWLILAHGFDLLHHTVQLRAKRLIDLVLSFALMLALSPLMLITAIAIKLDSKGPVFYRQTRTGLNGATFSLYKFRTMIEDAEKSGARWARKRDPRITRVGRLLRSTRIDELPQLWNVLLGEMSFIGPRPERPDFNTELEAAIPYYDLRHLVKPGVTGWAQVLYPYGSSVEDAREKLQYDLYYIKNYSVMLDFVILIRTLRTVLVGRGR
jgi:sugar transferase (PEP-CTERM system associated)